MPQEQGVHIEPQVKMKEGTHGAITKDVGERNRDRFGAFVRDTKAAASSEVFADNAFKNSGFDHSIGSVLNFHKSTRRLSNFVKFVSFPPGVSTHPRLNLSRRIAFWRLTVRTWVTWETFVAGGGHGGAVYAHYNFKIQSLEVVHE